MPQPDFTKRINQKTAEIYSWLESYEYTEELPLYTSVDIRDAGFKVASVDTNLFPAGFNNLCEHGLEDAVIEMGKAVKKRVPNCQNILIIAEEHTRNTWYLENLRILEMIIRQAGFEVKSATYLQILPELCQEANCVELETATGHLLKICSLQKILNKIKEGTLKFDLIIMNNDLTSGIPEELREMDIPIYPSIHAGWHARLKSYHFRHNNELINGFAEILGLDPWLFSCFDTTIGGVQIQEANDRERMMDVASGLFQRIQSKYDEHGINEKPFVFVKADSGTYGMGVYPIEDPKDLLELNKKGRKKLATGKSAKPINRFLLQEGVPTKHSIEESVGEAVIYQIDNNFVGGFYRLHGQKSARENLNSTGANFAKMCPHLDKYGHCGIPTEANTFDLYRIIARISGIAAHREIIGIETGDLK